MQVLQRLTAIETKLDIAIGHYADQESRLRILEAWRWKTVGMASTVGALLGTGGGALVSALI